MRQGWWVPKSSRSCRTFEETENWSVLSENRDLYGLRTGTSPTEALEGPFHGTVLWVTPQAGNSMRIKDKS